MSGPAARALAEWQAQRFEFWAAQLRISGVPLDARIDRTSFHWWESETRYVASALLTLERLFASTDEELKKRYQEERDDEEQRAREARARQEKG